MYTLGLTNDNAYGAAGGNKQPTPPGGWGKWSWAHNRAWLDSGLPTHETFHIATSLVSIDKQLFDVTRRRTLGAEILYLHYYGYEGAIVAQGESLLLCLQYTGNNNASVPEKTQFNADAANLNPPGNQFANFWTDARRHQLYKIIGHLKHIRYS